MNLVLCSRNAYANSSNRFLSKGLEYNLFFRKDISKRINCKLWLLYHTPSWYYDIGVDFPFFFLFTLYIMTIELDYW